MHVGATSLAAAPIAAGGSGPTMEGSLGLAIQMVGVLYVATGAVLWYESESIGIEMEHPDIAIEVTPNIGVTTE